MNINRTSISGFTYGEAGRLTTERGPSFIRRSSRVGAADRVEISREARERAADLRVPSWVRRITARLSQDSTDLRSLVADRASADAAERADRVYRLKTALGRGDLDFDDPERLMGAAAALLAQGR